MNVRNAEMASIPNGMSQRYSNHTFRFILEICQLQCALYPWCTGDFLQADFFWNIFSCSKGV